MSSSSSISSSDGDLGFSSTSDQVAGRVVEDIDMNNHFASSTTIPIARNKAFVGFPLSDDSPDLEAKHRVERAEENLSLRQGYEWVDFKV